MLIAIAIAAAMFTLVVSVSANSTGTYYLDITNNTDWKPASGEKLCATFTDSGGAQTGGVKNFTAVTNGKLYKVTDVPPSASEIQIYLVRNGLQLINPIPESGKKRVFYNNTKAGWAMPYIYSWTGSGTTDSTRNHAWPGETMKRIGTTNYWYYDTPFDNVIFNNGLDGNATVQTEDLKIESLYPVFSSPTGSTWDSAPYYKKYTTGTLASGSNPDNDFYVQKNDTLKLSKYPYSEADGDSSPRAYTNPQTIYLYNPDWTDASKVMVTWDFNDPYRTTVKMEKLTDANKPAGVFDGKIPNGFYVATVPDDAKIQFSYNLATSNQTKVPTGQENMCYNLKNGANVWCQLKDALGEVTDYTVGVETSTANDSNKNYAFWTDAVYYDYLSDEELLNTTWLRPTKAGTDPQTSDPNYNFDGAKDDWFEFYNFNKEISNMAAADSSWKYPLYFGNFCANWDAFLNNRTHPASRDTQNSALGKGYFGPNATGLTRFDYIVNNSNGLKPDVNDVEASNHYGVQGLSYSTSVNGESSLSTEGSVQYAKGKTMPYFDSSWLKKQVNGKAIGRTIRSSFPFYKKTITSGGKQVTTYKFDSNPGSNGTSDNVFFNWNGDTPQSVGYGRGTQYEVKDGYRNFMGNRDSAPGIFPFNNTAKTKGSRLANSDNLDYGYGVKINMDFRVPEGGKLPGGEDVKFYYSGDDDVWVYISEYGEDGKLKNSRLALDLGGNHKQAEGEINFNTMKSKATAVVQLKDSTKYRKDRIYINNTKNWNQVYVYAWNSDDGAFFKANYDSNLGLYYVSASQLDTSNSVRFDSKTMMTFVSDTNWTDRSSGKLKDNTVTNDDYGSGRDTLANHWGKVTYTDNVNWIDQSSADEHYSYKTNVETNFGFEQKRDTTYAQLDPTKTYHLTVFYMERGMIESNCKMEFTMTPAQNDLKVNKTVDTTDVNHGLEEALKEQKFDFTNSEEGVLRTTSRYTLNGETTARNVDSTTGEYTLKDGDTADFYNQFTTGSKIQITEKNHDTGVQYSTKWQVVDNVHGTKVAPTTADWKSGRTTDEFTLKDSLVETDNAKLQANIVNTPDVQSLTLSKKVRSEDDTTDIDTDKEFRFRVKIDLDGNGTYKAYPLKYTVHSGGDTTVLQTDATTGEFRFSTKDTVTIDGLPKGAKYQIEEVTTPGYAPLRVKVDNGTDGAFNGLMTGSIGDSDSTVAFTNREKPISTTLKAKKYITDGNNKTPYTTGGLNTNNELFSFTAHGLGEFMYEDGSTQTSIDVSNTEKTIQPINNNGEIIFANKGGTDKFLHFTSEGVYLYSIVENGIVKDNNKTSQDTLRTYKDDIGVDTQKFIAKVTVATNLSGELYVPDDGVEYYKWDGTDPTPATFTAANKVTDVEFNNPIINKGKLTIKKEDSLGSLDGVGFTVYKVDAEGEQITANTEVAATGTTSNGKVEFDDLDIYEKTDDGKYMGLMDYQWYAVAETGAKDGYFKEPTVHYFRLPILDGSDVKYSIEYTYVNGALVSPSSGSFPTFIIPLGITLLLLSFAGAGWYIYRNRRKQLQQVSTLKHLG